MYFPKLPKASQLLNLLFPPRCLACDAVLEQETYLCERCDLGAEVLGPHACVDCGEPGIFPTGRCQACRRTPWVLTRASAPFLHDGSVARAIHRFKYEDHPELAWRLARWARNSLSANFFEGYDAVCPIPLHRARFCSRRYDQATLLAVEWAKAAGLPLRHWLKRTRATMRQVGLSDVQREANVRGAFAARPEAAGAAVLLVDDVLTTGATANSAARVLYAAGARRVDLLTLARARKTS